MKKLVLLSLENYAQQYVACQQHLQHNTSQVTELNLRKTRRAT